MTVVVALDGHDASGKSTLARLLAERLDAAVVRPFGGARGVALMDAAGSGDLDAVVGVGDEALGSAVTSVSDEPAVFDRGWITVATLGRSATFEERWRRRLPTVVCWADLDETIRRLAGRDEPDESESWHRRYIERYREIATSTGVPVLRTDDGRDPDECVAELLGRIDLDLLRRAH